MTKAVLHNTTPKPVVQMAPRLSGLIVRGDKLKKMAWKLATSSDGRRTIGRAEKAAWTVFYSTRAYIVAIPCTTLADAWPPMMLASALSDICATSTGCEDAYPQINRALRAVMRVVADAAALDMKTVGADFYAANYTGPFPTVAVE